MEQPLVSIIVCTYNGKVGIEACMNSIGGLQYPLDKLELIVVNDASTDNTGTIMNDVASSLVRKGLAVTLLDNERKDGKGLGLYGSKRRAMTERRTPSGIIAVTDDDCEVHPDWLAYIVPHFENPNVGSVGGYIGSKNLRTPLERWAADPRNNVLCNFPTKAWAHGANSSYSNEGLQRIGGFDPNTVSGGDAQVNFELQRLGFIHEYEPQAKVDHQHRSTEEGVEKQFLKYGGGDFHLLLKYGQARFTVPEMTDLFLSSTKNVTKRPDEDEDLFRLRPRYDQLKASFWLTGYAKAGLVSTQ